MGFFSFFSGGGEGGNGIRNFLSLFDIEVNTK